MATIPPPYSPRDAERRAREAWRANAATHKAAARAQRNYWRAMRRPSIAGPVILILIGVVAMLIVTGRMSGYQFWMTYQRWWPLLFILVGVTLLGEWFLDRNQPHPIRRTAGGVVFLLILAGLAAGASYGHWNLGPLQDEFTGQGRGLFEFMGAEHGNDTSRDVEIPAAAQLQVQNPRGDVTITASADSMMHVRAHETAYSNSDDEAQRLLKFLVPNVNMNATNVFVRINGSGNGKSDLTIELPANTATDVNAGHGDITIEGLSGSVNASAGNGDVKFDNLSGPTHVRMSKGNFSAHDIRGDLSVDGRMDDVTLSEIRGKVLLDGDFFGSTHLERIEAPIHLHSSHTDFEIARIAGDLTMDSSDLNLQQAQGPIKIITRSKSIDLSQVFGDIHIENSNDDVTVNPGAPLGNVSINNSHGSINLALPPAASFSVDGRSHNGEIATDFPLSETSNDTSHTLTGEIGRGGPRITLYSDQGDIHLKKADFVPALPPIPPRPDMPSLKGAIPKMPRTPNLPLNSPPNSPSGMRHLRQRPGVTEQPAVQ